MFPFTFKYNDYEIKTYAEFVFENCQVRYRVQDNQGVTFVILPSGIPGPSKKIIWVQSNKPGEIIQHHELVQAMGEGIEIGIAKPEGWLPRFDSKKTIAEIDLRGRFLMMACDIEWTIIHIILYCQPELENNTRRLNSKEVTMANKIEIVIADMKKNKPQYYEEYKDDLEKLKRFRDIRNDLAHKRLFYEDSEFKKFKFAFIADDENGDDKLQFTHYTIEEFYDSLNTFIDLNLTLAKLVERLKIEFDKFQNDNAKGHNPPALT